MATWEALIRDGSEEEEADGEAVRAVGTGAGRPAWKPSPRPAPLEPQLCLRRKGRAMGQAAAREPCRPWPLPARGTDRCDQGAAVGCRVTAWS